MRIKTKFLLISFVSIFGSSLFPVAAHAATGAMYLSPGTVNAEINGTFAVQLRINPGTSINAVQATVGYSTSALQLLSTSLGAFTTCTQNSAGGGSVALSCAMLGSSTSSDSLIVSMSFKALAGSGSTSLTVSGNAASNGSYTSPAVSGGTINFYSPAPAPAPAPSSGSSSSSTATRTTNTTAPPSSATAAPATSPATTSPSATTAKVIFSLAPPTIQFTDAGFTVKTNVPVHITVKYGTAKSALTQSTNSTPLGTSNTVKLSQSSLIPGTTYYYQVVATDAQGNVTSSSIKSFTTKGYTVNVTVLDSHNRPLTGQTVTLHSVPMTTKTNGQGIATFINVAPGVHHLDYSAGGHTYSEVVYVANTVSNSGSAQTAVPQTAAVVLSSFVYKPSQLNWPLIGLLAVIVAAFLLGLSRFSFIRFAIKLRRGYHAVKGAKSIRVAHAYSNFSFPASNQDTDRSSDKK